MSKQKLPRAVVIEFDKLIVIKGMHSYWLRSKCGFAFWKACWLDWRPARLPWLLPCPSLPSLNCSSHGFATQSCTPRRTARSFTVGLDTHVRSPPPVCYVAFSRLFQNRWLLPFPANLCSHYKSLWTNSRTQGCFETTVSSLHSKSKSSYLWDELITFWLPCQSYRPAYLC